MHNIKKISISFIFSIINFTVIAQTSNEENNFSKSVDFLPPAPNAAAIAKVGFFNLNKNTGAPNINIPVLSAKGKKLSIDVSLTYASSGIKVDELASRVGMGWSLNAGGAVSRIIKGYPDEGHIRIAPWEILTRNWETFNFCSKITKSNNFYGYDSEPDIFTFNFNGYSGSFILDAEMKPILIPSGNFKIEVKLGQSEDWNIKIITQEGVSYFFGGQEATELTKSETTCGRTFEGFFPSTWYLKKIEHLNKESILFSYTPNEIVYDVGIGQTISTTESYQGQCAAVGVLTTSGGGVGMKTCVNRQRTKGVLLSSILIDQHARIDFEYFQQTYLDDQLLNKISFSSLFSPTPKLLKKVEFTYDFFGYNNEFSNENSLLINTPYLNNIKEYSNDESQYLQHSFNYNEPQNRPARLSFSQDHWGYFNGKINQTLIPPHEAELIHPITIANGNREPDFKFASKGMLNKIVYPTGGIDSIIYESNNASVLKTKGIYHEFECSVQGVGLDFYHEESKEIPFSINYTQNIKIRATFICGAESPNDIHHKGSLKVTNVNGSIAYDIQYFGNGIQNIEIPGLQPGDYIITITAKTNAGNTTVKLMYYPNKELVYENKIVGGVRVKEFLRGNKNEIPVIKKYYYAELSNLTKSSNSTYIKPIYEQNTKSRISKLLTPGGGQAWLVACYGSGYRLTSNSIFNLFTFAGSNINYSTVIESNGENFDLGCTETKFISIKDQPGEIVMGNELLNATKTNYSINGNGKILEESVYKKNTDGSLVIISKKENIYKFDSRKDVVINAYTVNQKYSIEHGDPPADTTCYDNSTYTTSNINCIVTLKYLLESFDTYRYRIFSPWIYIEKTTETIYDENGLNPQISVINNFYGNDEHQQITNTSYLNSKNQTNSISFTYPHDYPNDFVCREMVRNNLITPNISVKKYKDEVVLNETKNAFKIWENNNFEIERYSNAVNGNPLEVQGQIQLRDDFGNILEYTGKDEITNSILWGYKGKYPVAKIIGLHYNNVLQSLERVTSFSSFQELTSTDLVSALENLRRELPQQTMMATYTYLPEIGVEKISDINGKLNTYNYDVFNRLTSIVDQDGKIIKNITYSYSGSDITNTFKLYYNTEKNVEVRCGPCLKEGTIGTLNIFHVPTNEYYSIISVADANRKAEQSIQLMAQPFVNENGMCTNDNTICVGPQYKKIGCNCEIGVKICISSRIADPGEQGYYNTYRYKWSDNSMSDPFVEFSLLNCQGLINQL